MSQPHKPNVEITLVVWEDATYHDGDEPPDTVLCISPLKVIQMDDQKIQGAYEQFSDGEHRRMCTVPRGMVRRIKRIRVYIPEFDRS